MFAVSGCGQKAQTRTVEGDVTGQGVSIDTEETDSDSSITVSVSMAKTLNPLVNSDESVDMALSLLYEKLIVIGPDGKAEPNIAQSWTFNEDGSEFTPQGNVTTNALAEDLFGAAPFANFVNYFKGKTFRLNWSNSNYGTYSMATFTPTSGSQSAVLYGTLIHED